MEIRALGGRGVSIVEGARRLLADPPDTLVPLPAADVITLSQTISPSDETRAGDDTTGPFVIHGPGEYEVRGIFVIGVSAPAVDGELTTAYCINIGDLAVCHVGGLAGPLPENDREAIGAVDVLIVPLGSLGAAQAVELVSQLEPSVVVPLDDDGGNGRGERVQSFLREMGAEEPEVVTTLVVSPLRLTDQPQVKILIVPTDAQ